MNYKFLFRYILISFVFIFSLLNSTLFAQFGPQTNSSTNRGSRAPAPPQRCTPPPNGCFREEKAWEAGHWEFDGAGRRIWVPGQWIVRQIPIPCVEPVIIPRACMAPSLSPVAFQQALASIASRNFESSRLSVAQQIVTSNCMASGQVREIMLLFSFESSKLQIAKLAYPYVCDPNMYFVVNDAFSFNSSVRDLSAYIQTVGR